VAEITGAEVCEGYDKFVGGIALGRAQKHPKTWLLSFPASPGPIRIT
jgi:hypothetical protein